MAVLPPPPFASTSPNPSSPHFSIDSRNSKFHDHTGYDVYGACSSDDGSPRSLKIPSFSQPPTAPSSPAPRSLSHRTSPGQTEKVMPRRLSEIEYLRPASQAVTSREKLVLARLSLSSPSDDSYGLPLPDQTGFDPITSKPTNLVMLYIQFAVLELVTEMVLFFSLMTSM